MQSDRMRKRGCTSLVLKCGVVRETVVVCARGRGGSRGRKGFGVDQIVRLCGG